MTLSDFNRPKSKQMNKMPSLKNNPPPVKKAKEVKAFSGQGVRLGSLADPKEENKKPDKTFSGLTKVNKNQPKLDFKWRCQNCMMLNKVEENKTCPKCNQSRELSV